MKHTLSATGFRRRIYGSPLQFVRDLRRIIRRVGTVLALSLPGGISAGFRERLMLVVTGVNRCRHCAYGHEIMARRAGLGGAEVAALLMQDLAHCPEYELPALRHAIHFAECDGYATPEALSILEAAYGAEIARQIDTTCLLIQVGNRVGNSFDFLLSRVSRGRLGLLADER
jgi:AhpD family alkylhydroperoxidase